MAIKKEFRVIKEGSKQTLSVEDFFAKLNFSAQWENILGACYYLYRFEKMKVFSFREIQNILKESRIGVIPSNITDQLNKIKRKYLVISKGIRDNVKKWTISKAGEFYVKNRLEE